MQKPDKTSGFFVIGEENTIQDVWIAAIYPKEAVQAVQEVVCVHLRCRGDG